SPPGTRCRSAMLLSLAHYDLSSPPRPARGPTGGTHGGPPLSLSPRPLGGPGMRSFARDRPVARHRLAPGTLRRIAGFARPYRAQLAVFLALVLLDALLGAATPLVYRSIIDDGIAEGRQGLVVGLAA